MQITTIHSVDTEYSADSIEWCPYENYKSFFALGTYQLEGDNTNSTSPPCRRKGRIYLYRFDKLSRELTELQRQETAAILDMKWLPVNPQKPFEEQQPLLATANALGQIEVYSLDGESLKMEDCLHISPEDHNLLALSLDWNSPNDENKLEIVASDSKGDVNLIEYTNERTLHIVNSWQAHNFEAWICAFDKWNPNLIYTGGDDTFMYGFDKRSSTKILTNKNHIAGVTCLLSHPYRENMLLTGSYDERVRIYDTRQMKQALSEINLQGGIWRLKADPLKKDFILVACMYHNFSIIRLEGEQKVEPQLHGEYNEHSSICYGSDWCLDVSDDANELFMATCSFYDHKLCLSSITDFGAT